MMNSLLSDLICSFISVLEVTSRTELSSKPDSLSDNLSTWTRYSKNKLGFPNISLCMEMRLLILLHDSLYCINWSAAVCPETADVRMLWCDLHYSTAHLCHLAPAHRSLLTAGPRGNQNYSPSTTETRNNGTGERCTNVKTKTQLYFSSRLASIRYKTQWTSTHYLNNDVSAGDKKPY
jgi:hypothetical protein